MSEDRITSPLDTEAEPEPEQNTIAPQMSAYTEGEPRRDDDAVTGPTVLANQSNPPTEEILQTLDQYEAEERKKRAHAARQVRGGDVSDD